MVLRKKTECKDIREQKVCVSAVKSETAAWSEAEKKTGLYSDASH